MHQGQQCADRHVRRALLNREEHPNSISVRQIRSDAVTGLRRMHDSPSIGSHLSRFIKGSPGIRRNNPHVQD